MPCTRISSGADRLLATARAQDDITVDECMALLGRRSIMLSILPFALINSLPLPGIPGVSTVTGIPIMLLGLQILVGYQKLWLPRRIASHRIRTETLIRHMGKIMPSLKKIEHYLHPRLTVLTCMPLYNITGGWVAFMGFLLALPIPFTNLPFGLSITILAIGMIAQDGLVTLLGMVCSIAATVVLFLLLDGGMQMLLSWT